LSTKDVIEASKSRKPSIAASATELVDQPPLLTEETPTISKSRKSSFNGAVKNNELEAQSAAEERVPSIKSRKSSTAPGIEGSDDDQIPTTGEIARAKTRASSKSVSFENSAENSAENSDNHEDPKMEGAKRAGKDQLHALVDMGRSVKPSRSHGLHDCPA
jgi:hypothetical protein